MLWLLPLLLVVLPSQEPPSSPRPPDAAGPTPKPVHKRTAPSPRNAKSTTSTTTPERFPLESIELTGNRNLRREQILALVGLKVGQLASESDFEAARQRVLKSGAFEAVGYRSGPSAGGKGYAVTFEVTEISQVYPWQVEELSKSRDEIAAQLAKADPLFGDRIAGTKDALARYAAVISAFTGQKVKGQSTPDSSGELFALFRPDKVRPTVAEVDFRGNRIYGKDQLQKDIATAVGTPFSEELFQNLLERNIRPLYESKGYLRVAFPKISTAPARDVEGLAVTVQVDEGVPYQFGTLVVRGSGSLDDELTKAAVVEKGAVANFEQVKAGREAALHVLARRGYLQAVAQTDRALDDAAKTVNITIRVAPGPLFRFANLKIEGLDIVTEPGVRKLWGLKEGSAFNADYPKRFLDRIKEDGVLDELGETSYRTDVHSESHTVDVILTFQGAPAQNRQRRKGGEPETQR